MNHNYGQTPEPDVRRHDLLLEENTHIREQRRMERFVCALCCGPKVGAALQSCHHANDQLWRADLLLAENTHIREEPVNWPVKCIRVRVLVSAAGGPAYGWKSATKCTVKRLSPGLASGCVRGVSYT
jgi:hypothetical protein